MPECTELERELLDAISKPGSGNVAELRTKLAIARVPPDLRETIVSTWARKIASSVAFDMAFAKLEGIEFRSKTGDDFYEEMRAEAEKRAGTKE